MITSYSWYLGFAHQVIAVFCLAENCFTAANRLSPLPPAPAPARTPPPRSRPRPQHLVKRAQRLHPVDELDLHRPVGVSLEFRHRRQVHLSDELRRRLAQICQLHAPVHPSERDLLERLDHILAPQLLFFSIVSPHFVFSFHPNPAAPVLLHSRMHACKILRAKNAAHRGSKREGISFQKEMSLP